MEDIIKRLHPLERQVLPLLKKTTNFKDIVKESKLEEISVLRALQWLANKKILEIKESEKEIITLDKNGEIAVKEGLPERKLLELIEKEISLDELKNKSKFDDNEFNVSLGILKKKAAVEINNKIVSLTAHGKKLKKKEFLEESFLKKLPIEFSKLKEEDKFSFEELKKRKQLVKIDIVKERVIELSELGRELVKKDLELDLIEEITKEVILKESWKKKEFREYDLTSISARIYPGKRHFVNQAIDYIKKIWLEMGFKEMEGSYVQTGFWNFDALFTAQDHPGRDLHDTLYVKNLLGKLPKDERIVNKVKSVHETGGNTGSKGWQYTWNPKEALKLLLRSHTTALSAKYIANSKELPAKFFSVSKVFRNDTLDWSHLFEFHQVEGIVIDENANFKHLLGYLKQYYKRLGYDEVKFRPAYFPYTEMSVEPIAYDKEHKEWIELGGAGIFRPEVVKPLLGKDIPVLAWGQGLERGILKYYGIKDVRELYNNDLKKLREIKMWLR
ncbi:MAG: phenylalanine--tRNA ligase subunit alpha [Candidatus Woesearchaeota archaeon]|nr:MAG: phenylalanine--tRNA ligase subunit alpha [Candidatus Woesearchaeota archaeon]